MVSLRILLVFLLQHIAIDAFAAKNPKFSFPSPWDLFDPFHFFHDYVPKPDEPFEADTPEPSSISMADSPLVDYTTPEFIVHYGYHPETHFVTTEDGYILELHRIPSRTGDIDVTNPPEPVIVMHGVLASSADWVMNPPSQSIAFMLVDAGYDVWLPNLRGNTYSKKHATLDHSSKEFWQFSWHEMGLYDLPAIIDFVLSKTGFSKLHYVGHSMGTTSFFIMMDHFPEYNEKISAFHAMAPVTAVDNMKSPLHLLSPVLNILIKAADLFHIWQFAPSNAVTSFVATWFCTDDDYTQFICENTLFLLCGYNSKQLNTSMLPVYFAHTPAGTSTRCLGHYGETYQTGIFQPYLHSRTADDAAPVPYDLKKTTTPTYIYWGANDWMAAPEDVVETISALPNVERSFEVEDPKWSHSDFMWGIDANKLVYSRIICHMRSNHCD